MELLSEYWGIEEGYELLYNDYAFCAYKIVNDEFYLAHMYVNREKGNSLKFFKEIKELAKSLGASHISAIILMNTHNADTYTDKLMTFLRFGAKIVGVYENKVVISKQL